jgi:hypothetical protein
MESLLLPDDAVLTPLPIDEDISSLSAILLDDGYYNFLKFGVRLVDGLPILGTGHIIPFKAKAWLDLTERKAKGGQVDSKNIKKHKRDVIAISDLLPASSNIELPMVVRTDLKAFIAANTDSGDKLRRIVEFYVLS